MKLSFKHRYGPWAVIAGASHGMGAAFAELLAERGVNCVLVARRTEALEKLKAELTARHAVEVLWVSQDLSRPGAAQKLIATVGAREVGLFVYNAGGDPFITRFLDSSRADWASLLRLNALTLMECAHAFGGAMLGRRRGGLILVGSQAALGGIRKLAVYSATKGFAMNLGESLWAEWRDHGVDVLNLLIGTVDTPTMREAMVKLKIPDALNMPLPKAEDIARLALAELGNGPTLIHPEDVGLTDPQHGPGFARRKQVIGKSAEAAVFIGND
ncbi:SDR family NAD(P)-dependent oxidoreductase [Pseudomonas typographi]|uniref:SDR family NAD(P)-dependent oxidoreductase n=1 Tax=Pseudomonas typographi TaxID=2715964 RepID=UPI001683610C|nr:SDR family NAD(P)-dependent oxidoreductase [Pseudomonas typographi]MBD1552579.1 SDR family NAD(P)-dependent oxidoreductase [Pseudomonas typographi]